MQSPAYTIGNRNEVQEPQSRLGKNPIRQVKSETCFKTKGGKKKMNIKNKATIGQYKQV